MEERLQARGYPAHTRVKQIKHHSGSRKAFRIESLLPDIQSGKIRFHQKFRNTPELDQFEMYPMHAHDDFPDAVSMLTMVAKTGRNVVQDRKSTRLNSSHVANSYADICLIT